MNKIIGITGCSFLHSYKGISYKVEDLSKNLNKECLLFVGFDNESWQYKAVNITSIEENSESPILKIKTVNSEIKIQDNVYVYVNRNGELNKIFSRDISPGDVLLVPKNLSFHKKDFILQDIFPNRNIKGSTIKQRAGSAMHEANVSMSSSFMMNLAFISGMIDCKGTYNISNGDILFSSNSFANNMIAHLFSSAFLTEPSIEANLVRLKNIVVAMLIDEFIKHSASYDREIVTNYLAGYFHANSNFGFIDNDSSKPFVSFDLGNDSLNCRLFKCLLVIGIIPVKTNKSYTITDSFFIENFFTSIQYLSKNLAYKVDDFIYFVTQNHPRDIFGVFGYKFGKSLSSLKKKKIISTDKYNKISIIEKEDAIMNYPAAFSLSEFIKKSGNKSDPVDKLVNSFVIGALVVGVEKVKPEKTYNLCFSEDCGIFINNTLFSC